MKNIKLVIAGSVLGLFITGCGGIKPMAGQGSIVTTGKTVYVANKASYKDGATIQADVLASCNLDTKSIDYMVVMAKEAGINLVVSGEPKADGLLLKLTIDDAVSMGNAFTGHRKYVTISGGLYEGDALKSSYTSARMTGGGAFGGYKSSCGVLMGSLKAIAKDTMSWVLNPVDKARLGNTGLIK